MEKSFLNRFLPMSTTVCSFMVIGIHSYNAGGLDKMTMTSRIEGFFAHGLFMAAVPIFFFISGYLFFRNANTMSDVFDKMIKRVSSVILPFLSWSAVYYLFYAFGSKFFRLNSKVDISVIGGVKGIVFYEYVFPMWFMFMLIIFIILSPILMKILTYKKLSVVVLLIVALLGVMLVEVNINVDGDTRSLFAFNYFLYYFGGAMFAKRKNNIQKIVGFVDKIPTLFLTIMIVFCSILESLLYDEVLYSYNKRLLVPVIALGVVMLLVKYSDKLKIKLNISTMLIYGVHPLMGIIIGKTIWRAFNTPALAEFALGWGLNILLSCIAAFLIRKIKLLNIFLGGNR